MKPRRGWEAPAEPHSGSRPAPLPPPPSSPGCQPPGAQKPRPRPCQPAPPTSPFSRGGIGRGLGNVTPASLPGVSGTEHGGGAAPGMGPTPFPGPGQQFPSFATPSHPLPAAPTYAAQLPVEVAPADSLAAPVQPAQLLQQDLRRSEGAARPPRAGPSHEPRSPCAGRGRAARWCLCSPAHTAKPGSALRTLPRCQQQQRGTQPSPEEPAPGGAPRPVQCRKPHPHSEGQGPTSPGGLGRGRPPTVTKKPGNSGAAQAPGKGSPGGRPGAGKLPPPPSEVPSRMRRGGWGRGREPLAENSPNGTKAPKPQGHHRAVETGSNQDSGRVGAPPHSGTGDETGLSERGGEGQIRGGEMAIAVHRS